ncbi:MAG: uracil phosphoribosyltransferase [Candidatus Moranbacteria bacterium]|nr:uracil phosphoribosyltransferase [Candidatus Moranbacteria bacterium]
MLINLGKENSILNQFIAELRNIEIQNDPLRFRTNLERIGQIFAYEISKKLEYEKKEVLTPLGSAEVNVLKDYPVLAAIIRSGLPFHQGLLSYFDRSENAFISSYRKHHKDGSFDVDIQYVSKPSMENKNLILIDPMVATGMSMALTYRELIDEEKPRHTHLIAVIASLEGVNYIKRKFSSSEATFWVGAIDEELTAEAYIVPGLGDAGDLAFGSKL